MNSKTLSLTKAAAVASLYAVFTFLSAAMGLGFSGIQLRISEALTVLPLFSVSYIPALTVGCFVSNLVSSVSVFDCIIGTFATLISAILTRYFRNKKTKGYPILSMSFPVIINALFIGAQLAFFSVGEKSFLTVFFISFLTVGIGQLLSVFVLGSFLYSFLMKNGRIRKIISD